MPPKAKNNPKGKKRGLDRNVSLEKRLIDLGVNRDVIFRWTREEQSAELERWEGRAPRDRQTTFDELFADAHERNPIPPPVLAETETAEVADLASPAEVDYTNHEDDHPMDIGGDEAADRLIQAAEPTNGDEWLLQQPMQPPIAGQLAAEAVEISLELLDPLDDQTREAISNMPFEQQIISLQSILNEQWRFLRTPPLQPIRGDPLSSIPADLHPIVSQFPPHLQCILGDSNEYAQRKVLAMPELEMYRQLYRGMRTRTEQLVRYNQQREQLRRQIILDPLLSINPYASQWLQSADNAFQENYLAADTNQRLEILQENNIDVQMLGFSGNEPQDPLPDHLRTAEQIAMQHHNFTDPQQWRYSTARSCWIDWLRRNGRL